MSLAVILCHSTELHMYRSVSASNQVTFTALLFFQVSERTDPRIRIAEETFTDKEELGSKPRAMIDGNRVI